ncbi:arginine--tRNA ligase [Streptomyces tateyamensis]|uniref:Arginine--tRNA ligase n=1 Tax=Streptomyces tateyamensis TaxID=565073 RepID=A0A2V4NWT4_9ACTN|nr:arginine--tRNA ligase [Streptomyces tateyamensis]PYC81331.1 arginine--tRNA ligase [Streptomyces tateyamensis]
MTSVPALHSLVEDAISAAAARVLPRGAAGRDPLVRPSEHADFQSNLALALAKQAGLAPRELAARLLAELADGPLEAELSGPGFLNLTVGRQALWQQLAARLADDRLGVGTPLAGTRTVVDYSGPNIAKEMHVGHLRSTVIGDALARVLGHLGSEVARQNHLGDWGTQFGMLIQYLEEHPQPAGIGLAELDELYRAGRQAFDADPAFRERAQRRLVALQSGDPATLAVWRELVAASTEGFQRLYDRLGVLLTPADVDAESRFNDQLDGVVEELRAAGLAVESEGAVCVFVDGVEAPLIVRKKDGGYGYPATDLATLRHRVEVLAADRILYVVDARQALHFRQVFAVGRLAGWLPDSVQAVHVPFGMVLGTDGKPFKTRSGGTVRLADLLDAAIEGARTAVAERETVDEAVVRAAGIGSVKYADLSNARTKNYVFDIDQMTSLAGNTAVYLQYAHARVRSILARAGAAEPTVDPAAPMAPAERALLLHLDGFGAVLDEVADTLEPHRLTGYLFALAKALTEFYAQCPVLKAGTPAVRANRLALCTLTARTLVRGLGLLGIEAPERM